MSGGKQVDLHQGRRGDDTGRREDDTVIGMLRQQAKATSDALSDHIRECAKMQKRVFVTAVLLLLWVVSHSPEAARLAAKAFPSFGGP